MIHRQDEIRVYQEIQVDDVIFRLEEFWEEDDAGFCCVDYVLAKHTRLKAVSAVTGKTLQIYDLDSKEYDKHMELMGEVLEVTYHPECDVECKCRINVNSLYVLD